MRSRGRRLQERQVRATSSNEVARPPPPWLFAADRPAGPVDQWRHAAFAQLAYGEEFIVDLDRRREQLVA